jgi:hypothetical protein
MWDGLNLNLCFAKQALYCLNNISSPFCSCHVGDGGLMKFCPGWSWTSMSPISASQVARITGISHQHLATSHLISWCLNFLICKMRIVLWQEGREGEERLMSAAVKQKKKPELGNVTWRPKKGHLDAELRVANEMTCDYVWDKLHPPTPFL